MTNITNFGAFVDIGVKDSGLVHVSHLSDKFVRDPMEVVSLGQQVTVPRNSFPGGLTGK